MESKIKKYLKEIFIFLFLFTPLYAQQNRFVQKVEWEIEPNAYEYKVEIELLKLTATDSNSKDNKDNSEQKEDELKKVQVFTTTNNYIEFSYNPGLYRYRVFSYDFLGRECNVTEWVNFEIIKAYEPKFSDADTIQPEKNKKNIEIHLDLEDVTEETQVVLVNTETQEEVEGKLTKNKKNPDEKIAVFPFVDGAEYKLKITNPGGLTAESETMDFTNLETPDERAAREKRLAKEAEAERKRLEKEAEAERKRLEKEAKEEKKRLAKEEKEKNRNKEDYIPEKEVYFLLGGGIFMPLNESYLFSYNNQYEYSPAFDLKIGFMPFIGKNNRFGFELSGMYSFVEYKTDSFSLTLPTEYVQLNLVYQLRFLHQKLGLSVRAGGSIDFTQRIKEIYGQKEEVTTIPYFGWQAGLSFSYYPFNYLYLEIGVEYLSLFTGSNSTNVLFPMFNIGWRF